MYPIRRIYPIYWIGLVFPVDPIGEGALRAPSPSSAGQHLAEHCRKTVYFFQGEILIIDPIRSGLFVFPQHTLKFSVYLGLARQWSGSMGWCKCIYQLWYVLKCLGTPWHEKSRTASPFLLLSNAAWRQEPVVCSSSAASRDSPFLQQTHQARLRITRR